MIYLIHLSDVFTCLIFQELSKKGAPDSGHRRPHVAMVVCCRTLRNHVFAMNRKVKYAMETFYEATPQNSEEVFHVYSL